MTETPDPLKVQIKQGIVRSLRLPIPWEDIGDATPLFDGGLGLDSIDVLELVLEIERTFGVAIGDEKVGMQVLRSVDTIAEYVRSQGGKESV
jgi:acyl carrier protein